MEMNSHIRDTASQHSEDTPQVNKCMDLTQEVPNRSENAGKKRDHKRTELSKHAFYESHIDNAAQSTIIKEDYAMKVANVAKAADNASVHTDVFPANYQHPVEQTISAEEVFEMMAEKEISPTKFTSLINNHEQMKAGIVARGGGRVVKSCSTELTDKCLLQLGTFKSGNDVCVETSSISINSQYPDGMMQGSDAADEWNIGITRSKEQIGSELLSLENPKLEAENEQKSIELLAFTNDKCVNGSTCTKAPEISIQRFSVESNSEKLLGDEIEHRKSPSFDFGVSYDAKSEESDQTPLLYPEKTLTRSLSLDSRAKFSNLLEYEAVAVEEKTIRMEKNDYQVSKVPTLGLLKTGENDESSSEMDSKTSPKGSGRRQLKPSFFSIAPHQHQFIK
ncbi:hypothetical protein KY289_027300 [Solanum tuberosum]|nr:hypothetical protein KY289_027300 [Solanum tuberosum]